MNNKTPKSSAHTTECSQCLVRHGSLFSEAEKSNLNFLQGYRKNQIGVSAKTDIFHEGEKHNYIYTLYSGWAILYKTISNNGKRQILRFLLPGDLIGYHTILNGTLTHSASTITASTLCTFPRQSLKKMLLKNSELALRLMDMESRDMNLCQSHLMAAGRKTAVESIAFILLELFYRAKSQIKHSYNETDNSIDFPISQEDLGDAVGLTNVHVNRVIKSLTDKKLIICHKKRLTILNLKELSKIAEFDPEIINSQS